MRTSSQIVAVLIAIVASTIMYVADPTPFSFGIATAVALLLISGFSRPDGHHLLGTAVILPLSMMSLSFGNNCVVRLTPHTIDATLNQVDEGVSTHLYRAVAATPVLYHCLQLAYVMIPLFIAFVLVMNDKKTGIAFLRSLALATIIAPFFYCAFPAVGPAYIHDALAARNCVPSLHMTWAFLCLAFIPRRLQWVAMMFLALTATATIGLGEHYLLDIVAAVPYSIAVVFLESSSRRAINSK